MKKWLTSFFLLILVGLGILFVAYQHIQQFMDTPVNVKADQLLTVERGTTGNKLATLLEQEKILDNANLLPYLLKLNPQLNKIKAGTYSMQGVNTVADLIHVLNQGKEAQFSIQFIEGDNFANWRKIWKKHRT